MPKFLLFLVSSAAFIFLAFIFIVPFSLKEKPEMLNSSPSITKPSSVPSLSPSPWLTYSNNHNGYSINYPRDWERTEWEFHQATKLNINQSPQEGMIWQQAKFEGRGRSFQVVLWVNRQKAAIPSWLRWYRHQDLDLKKIPASSNYQVFGQEAFLIFQEKNSWGFPAVRIFFQNEDKIFELIAQNPNENLDKIYLDMIASFQLKM